LVCRTQRVMPITSQMATISECRYPHVEAVERDTTYPVPSIQVTAQEQNMNAPPNVDTVTAHSDSDVVHWLTNDTRDERFIHNIFAELCVGFSERAFPSSGRRFMF
jgi:hypothetical protein